MKNKAEMKKRIFEKIDSRTGLDLSGKNSAGSGLGWKARTVITACAVLVLGLCFGGYAYAEEVKEYKTAITFFENNGLLAEGLTKAEIKAVYKDITTCSYSYGKTAAVIGRSLETNSVPGWEVINAEAPSVNEDEAWRQYLDSRDTGVFYHFIEKATAFESAGLNGKALLESRVEKYENRELIWSYSTDRIRIFWTKAIPDGVLAIGILPNYEIVTKEEALSSPEQLYIPAVMKLSGDGELMWFCSWNNGRPHEQISSVCEMEDGGLTVLSTVRDDELSWLSVSRISANGKYGGSVLNPTGDIWVCDASACEGGCLAIAYSNSDFSRSICRIDAEGRLADMFEYSTEDENWYLEAVTYYGGRYYISATVSDKARMEEYVSLRGKPVSTEESTRLLKEAYSAVLLVCEKAGGRPEVFFRAPGSAGEGLTTDENGRLVWDVKEPVSIDYQIPLYGGPGRLYKYVFTGDGRLEDRIDTGEISYFSAN